MPLKAARANRGKPWPCASDAKRRDGFAREAGSRQHAAEGGAR